ncbi:MULTISPECIES: SWIM zinc finger family protein [unclassified Nocardia]|uniref:SWIM zinc finger family protein n=1 Tax=unclassified Nocardia TaxID=2637762 RepID=UPI001CE4240C|nr:MULTISPECIES: SWIM zinc finger family protein [unclassified Nocardia]
MAERWTVAGVEALAPDASSVSAARKLAGRWRDTGCGDGALWGLCRGSGAEPYRTVVDLSGPAYKCTCPSRKIPCKHALSLLFDWAEGKVGTAGEPPGFAAEWLAARAAKAAAGTETVARTANPATAAQRRVRVGAGLEELDIWLGDQVRTGLGQTDRSFQTFEAIAARMVDAQAPGIASALRQLPAIAMTRAEWPELMLREFARLHLLAAAHRRLDELDPALQASVRGHIGYPTHAETVRDEPPVRDHWQVLGRRVTEEERLYTRRIWLYGRRTRRWALLVDHSFGTPNFAAEVPAPGLLADADVHFYPGAAPLRALWGAGYAAAQPFTTLPVDDGSIATALTEHARALGADPWLRSWPVLLTAVTPVRHENSWYVVESDGTALPLAVLDEPWRLLGIAGGYPVTLAGEWTADGLAPISVFTAGEVTVLDRTDPVGRTIPNLVAAHGINAAALTSAALLGTARRNADATQLAAPVARAAAGLTADPALRLLETAALDGLFARGGISTRSTPIPEPAAEDHRRRLPDDAAASLGSMLRDRSPFLPEWFAAAEPHDYRAPDELCGQLLEYARTSADSRDPLLRLAGERGRWLAAQHPEWRTLVRPETPSDEIWRFGSPPERITWLTRLRAAEPESALTALTETWPKESGPVKAELLAVLAEGISAADEPLLETALDDRRADVRRTAAGLLALLPDSAFAHRMVERAQAWVPSPHGHRIAIVAHRLAVELPDTLDDAARRDGIHDRPVEFAYRWDGAPDPAAGWLRQLMAATPLRHWGQVFGGPREAVTAKMPNRFRQPILDGWVDAALSQRDSAWAAALFDAGVPSDTAMLRRRELFALLPAADRTQRLLRLDGSWLSELEALLPAMGHPWPDPLAQHLILLLFERARAAARRPGAYGTGPAAHRSLLAAAAVHFPFTAASAVAVVARRCADDSWQRAFDQLATAINQRSVMLEELR